MKCPECSEKLPIGSTFCECGWRDKAKKFSDPNHHRCKFEVDGRRCRLLGAVSLFNGPNIDYFCPWHYQVIANGKRYDDKNKFEEFAAHRWPKENKEWLWRQAMAFNGSQETI